MSTKNKKKTFRELSKMSLYPNIKEFTSESDEEADYIDLLSRELDTTNPELVELFTQLEKHPNSISHLKSFILALTRTKSSNNITDRLASYLNSHVTLLEAITHNVELASLFLISENGKQTFTSVHKAFLQEQAARTRVFLKENGLSNITNVTHLSDYKYYISNVESIDSRLEELDTIAKDAFRTKNINSLKNAFKEVYSLLAGSMVFNDVVLRKKAEISQGNLRIVQNAFPSAPKDPNSFIQWIQNLIDERNSVLNKVSTTKESRTEISDLQRLYNKTSSSLFKEQDKSRCLADQVQRLQRELEIAQDENSELKDLLERTKLSVKEQMDENQILLKHMKRESSSKESVECLTKKVCVLKEELCQAKKFICKLQKQIEDFRRRSKDKNDYKEISVSKKHHKTRENTKYKENMFMMRKKIEAYDTSSCSSSSPIKFESDSCVSDLDREIQKLESNVRISRKILEENSKLSK